MSARPVLAYIAPPIVLAALAGVLVAYGIGAQDVWYDEAVSLRYATHDLETSIGEILGRDTNGLVYYAALRAWVFVFGRSEEAARALSAICAVAAVPILYWIGTRAAGRWAGLLAGLLLATSAMFVAYAQEARMYAPAMLAVTVSTALLLVAVERRNRGWFALYGVAAGIAIDVHLFAGATFAGQIAWLHWRGQGRDDLRRLVVAVGAATVVASPMALLVAHPSNIAWIPAPTWDLLVATFLAFAGSSALLLWAGIVGLGTGTAIAWRERRRGGRTQLLLVATALTPITLGILVMPVHSFLVARYFIVALPAIFLVLAMTVVRLPKPLAAGVAVALIAVNLATVAAYHEAPAKYPWSSLSADLAGEVQAFDGLVVDTSGTLPIAYYVDQLRLADMPSVAPPSAILDVIARRPRRVWLVFYRWAPLAEPEAALEAAGYRPSGRDQLYEPVRVRAYVDRSP